MFGLKSRKSKNVTENSRHSIIVKTDLGDNIKLTNLQDVRITKIIDIFYIFCDDENAKMRHIYGTMEEKKAKKMQDNLLEAYNKGCHVVTLS